MSGNAATTPELLRELADAVDKDRRHANSFLTRTMRQAATEIEYEYPSTAPPTYKAVSS